jgi:oligopeptide/dipeptide ABC transporter ATP-binding protein
MNLLEVVSLEKRFPVGKAPVREWLKRRGPRPVSSLHAVDNVSFTIAPGESVGLVGESGCGKSTLVRLITRMLDASEGDIIFQGRNIGFIPARRFSASGLRPKIQMVFQDPADSLDPRQNAFAIIAEPLRRLTDLRHAATIANRVCEAAGQVGLPRELLSRLPHQLSGGQKARVGIARAIVLRPQLLVLDEPTAALDVSVQATILKLLDALRQQLAMSYLFVSHDLNVVRMVCDRVLVMYLGRIVEQGPAARLFEAPAHPYTRALLQAIPVLGAARAAQQVLPGEPRSPIDPDPNVCRFFGRCPRQVERCRVEAPVLRQLAADHHAACHFAREAG